MRNRKQIFPLILAMLLAFCACTGQNPTDSTTPTNPVSLSQYDLVCVEYSSFNGEFPEDGSGRQVQNVAAMLIRNDSAKFLDYALVTCQVGDRTGTFKVTGLPAGASVWVLEQNGLTLTQRDVFEVKECTDYSFRSDAILQTDKLQVTTQNGTVTVTNVSGKTLENVCIYYKTVFSDGNFFGGITYMLGFDNLSPNQTVQKQTSHFGADSQIVRYSFLEQ